MKNNRRMQILVDLAKRKEDSAAQLLARDKAKVQQDLQKLHELRHYAEQY